MHQTGAAFRSLYGKNTILEDSLYEQISFNKHRRRRDGPHTKFRGPTVLNARIAQEIRSSKRLTQQLQDSKTEAFKARTTANARLKVLEKGDPQLLSQLEACKVAYTAAKAALEGSSALSATFNRTRSKKLS